MRTAFKNMGLMQSSRLVEEYPEHVVAWFAVGCYYQSIGRYDSARQYFGKATTIDATFAPAWLGFGHSFAAQDESDQARIPLHPVLWSVPFLVNATHGT